MKLTIGTMTLTTKNALLHRELVSISGRFRASPRTLAAAVQLKLDRGLLCAIGRASVASRPRRAKKGEKCPA